jgi:4-amino-4-deoxy-L-arabinose transferase-like glycosyltransferase
MNIASFARSTLSPIERLIAALMDPHRRERAAFGTLVAYVAVWTLYGVLSNGSRDVHFDMGELITWTREPALGYAEHPPLVVWLAALWFTVFPRADWASYLLAMTAVGIGLWAAWRLSARWLDGEKRIVALALLTLIPLLNFQALRFNPNVVIIPLWPLTTLWFLRSFETRRPGDAAIAGVFAAAAVLGKYWSLYLLAGLALAALLDSRRGIYLRSVAPWVTVGVAVAALAPHYAWLAAHDFVPLRYAINVFGGWTWAQRAGFALHYLAGATAYVALPVGLALLAAGVTRGAAADMLLPATDDRRFAALAFWVPLLLPALVVVIADSRINSISTMPCWTLLPIVLLSSPLVTISVPATLRITALAVAFPLIMVVVAPVIALVIHFSGIDHYGTHYRLVAAAVEREWRQASAHPLRMIGGDPFLVRGVEFYLTDRPSTSDDLLSVDSRRIDRQRIETEGMALVCPVGDLGCKVKANLYAAREPTARRTVIDIVRRYLGFAGAPERYLIVVVPPRT